MSIAQNSLPASDVEPTFPECVPDYATGLIAEADREPLGPFGTDNGADPGEPSMLSRPIAPQGRKSLFRR